MQAIQRQFLNTHSSMMMHVHIIRKRNTPYSPDHIDKEFLWNMIEQYFKINQSTICGPSRKRKFINARFYCYKALREAKWGLKTIGKLFSRDHSCVCNGLTRLNNHIATEPETMQRYEHFKKYISIALYA